MHIANFQNKTKRSQLQLRIVFVVIEKAKLRSYWLRVASDIQADHLAKSTKANYERKWQHYRNWC